MVEEYKVKYYAESQTGKSPVLAYILSLDSKSMAKVEKYIKYLRLCEGYLDEPYSKHITGKIRELRVDFSHTHHRIFYFTFVGKNIILLHGFLKKTPKTPHQEIARAVNNYNDFMINQNVYDY